jgi:hypothetical protein
LWGSEWTQQWAFNASRRSYSQVQNYELFDTDAASSWNLFYATVGNAAFGMARDASADADAYYRGIGKLFLAWDFQLITDFWGPAPYTDAFKPEIREPKYDTQQFIYNGILANLDTAVTLFGATGARRPTSNDLLFAGDMTRWNKLAHYLQARANLRLAYASGEDKTARANKALAALAGHSPATRTMPTSPIPARSTQEIRTTRSSSFARCSSPRSISSTCCRAKRPAAVHPIPADPLRFDPRNRDKPQDVSGQTEHVRRPHCGL